MMFDVGLETKFLGVIGLFALIIKVCMCWITKGSLYLDYMFMRLGGTPKGLNKLVYLTFALKKPKFAVKTSYVQK